MSTPFWKNLMEGARNYIDSVHIRKDETVAIFAGINTEPELIQAFYIAATELGAKVNIIMGDAGTSVENAAMRNANVLIGLGFHSMAGATFFAETNARGGRCLEPTAEFIASEAGRFPHQIITMIAEKCRKILGSGKMIRVTDSAGSDLRGMIDMDYAMAVPGSRMFSYDPRYPVVYGFIGSMTPLGLIFPIGLEGVMFFDYAEGYQGRMVPPIKLTFKNEWVTKVEGTGAEWLEALFERYENLNHVSEFGTGLHPKIDITLQGDGKWGVGKGTHLVSHKAGITTVSLGASWGGRLPKDVVGTTAGRDLHFNSVKASLYVDKKVLVDRGRLTVLDDPEVRKKVAKYGDPDELLRDLENPPPRLARGT